MTPALRENPSSPITHHPSLIRETIPESMNGMDRHDDDLFIVVELELLA